MKDFCAFSRRAVPVIVMLFVAVSGFSYDYFAEGERLFHENKLKEAIPLLYQASTISGTDPKVFSYLGICYQGVGKYADAISIVMKGVSVSGTDRKVLFFIAGNSYYLQNMYAEAETMYSHAIEIDSAYALALLNRAGTRIRLEQFQKAVDDYTIYLTLDPASCQKDSIRQLISLLSGEIQARADATAKAEAAKAAAAAEQATAEAEKKAAAERYQKLLDAVSSSLQSVDGASTSSTGTENVMDYNEEGKLE
jgi:tetratricopeptide (TPR) repeat protein